MRKLICMLCFSIIMLFTISSYASDNFAGISIIYGKQHSNGIGCYDSNYKWTESGVVFKYGKYFLDKKYRVSLEPSIVHLRSESYHDNSIKNGTLISGRLMFYRDFMITEITNFSIGLGGGFGHLSPSSNQPGLANSGVYGLMGGNVGLSFKITESSKLEICYGFDHISDPFHNGNDGDTGRNFTTFSIGFLEDF